MLNVKSCIPDFNNNLILITIRIMKMSFYKTYLKVVQRNIINSGETVKLFQKLTKRALKIFFL
jgi:hypothetical protein